MSTASGNSEAIRIFDTTLRDGEQPRGAAILRAIREVYPRVAPLRLFRVDAATEGTDPQTNASGRLEENGRPVTGRASDTDTLLAAANACVNALNRLLVKRKKHVPEALTVAR